jgi:hypothetical protein
MRALGRLGILAVALPACHPGVALAGVPTPTLTDLSRLRVRTISCFLVGFCVSAWLIKLLWNRLATELTFLPKLTYGKALGLTTLWGLLSILALAMVSGARELMAPNSWEKQGSTDHLIKEPELPLPEESQDRQRQEKLELVRAALWDYARGHGDQFPPDLAAAGLSGKAWRAPGSGGCPYLYISGLIMGQGAKPLLYEPADCGEPRLVLLTNGEIKRMGIEDIARALVAEKP